MRSFKLFLLLIVATSAGVGTRMAVAFAPEQHQALTFIAAKAVNRCLDGVQGPRLSALQVRYLARANVSLADSNMFVRMFRWNYYNPADATERSVLGVIDTRLHEHFNELTRRLESDQSMPRRYADLGRVISYLQDVATPSRAVPVYTNRFWRLSFSDRFDHFEVDTDAVTAAVTARCDEVLSSGGTVEQLMSLLALDTIEAVQAPIFGMPVTWEAFWRLAEEPGDFGEYGPAGNNFGRETEFECAQESRCVLLDDDPLYRDFALQRHAAAVLATMRAMALMQEILMQEVLVQETPMQEAQFAPTTSSPDP